VAVASVLVDGLAVPLAVGGHPALDFCNTCAGWGSPAAKEYLQSHAHLTVWAAEIGLVGRAEVAPLRRLAGLEAGAARSVLDRAIKFRDALYQILTGPPTQAAWAGVNGEVGAAASVARLRPPIPGAVAGADGVAGGEARAGGAAVVGGSAATGGVAGAAPDPRRAGWELVVAAGPARLELPLLAVAWSAADLLTSIGPGGVEACPGRGCGWLFHDPRGRRRWCSMAWCGNRAKARRHAARRQPVDPPAGPGGGWGGEALRD
jgi:predicted RNA-binding Zn ribbon-like protein